MPVFNESQGIVKTLTDLDRELAKAEIRVELFLQDDCSTDSTLLLVEELRHKLAMRLSIESNKQNSGHGPTTQRAYVRASHSSDSIILQLDSDGQYNTSQLPELLRTCRLSNSIVIGCRSYREEPWYRKCITSALRFYLFLRWHRKFSDANSPIRVYPRQTLKKLLTSLPSKSLIPNIYLTIVSSVQEAPVIEIPVEHKVRNGESLIGTMWSDKKSRVVFVPRKLVRFCLTAFVELRRFERELLTK